MNILKATRLFFKSQFFLIVLLTGFLNIPFLLLCLFIPQIPYTHFFFFIILFFLKFILYDEKAYEKRVKPICEQDLLKEEDKKPSQHNIFQRVLFYKRSRDLTIILSGIGLLVTAIIFERFG